MENSKLMENSNQNNKIEKKLKTLKHYEELKEESPTSATRLIDVLNALKEKGYEIKAGTNQSGSKCLEIFSKNKDKLASILIRKRQDRLDYSLCLRKKKSQPKELCLNDTYCKYIFDEVTNYIEGTKQESSIKEYDIKEMDKLTNQLCFYKKMHDNKEKGPEAIKLVNEVFKELIDNGYKIKYYENNNILSVMISKEDISFSSYIVERGEKKFQLEIQLKKDKDGRNFVALNLTSKNFEKRRKDFIGKLNEFINKNSKESKVEHQEKDLNKTLNNTSNNKVSKEELLFSENEEKVEIKKENKISYAKIHESFNALAAFLTLNGLDGFGSKDEKKHCTGITHNLNREQNYNEGDVIEINFKFNGVNCMISFELMDKYENDGLPMAMVQYSSKDMNIFKLMDLIKEFEKVNKTNVLGFGYSAVKQIQRKQKTIKKEFSEFGESYCEEKQPGKKQCIEEKKGGKEVNLAYQTPTESIPQGVQLQQK